MIDRFVLLIGAMKAGTTALYCSLVQHPQIAGCTVKEPNALCDRGVWTKGLEAYSRLWAWDARTHRWAIDASTGYAKLPVVPNAVLPAQRLPAEFRFLYAVRDPIARIRSQYLHSLAEGWTPKPIHEGLAPDALLYSNYHFQLLPYATVHGRERLCVLSYEEYCAERQAVLQRVCAFLGIDAGFAFRDTGPMNDSAIYRSKLLARLLERRGLLPATLPVEACGRMVPASLRALVLPELELRGAADAWDEACAELERSITPSPAQEDQIRAALDADLARFRNEWGIDAWTGRRCDAELAAA